MKIVMLSNYYNHHQKFLSDALYTLTGGKFWFIETQNMEIERLQIGWGQRFAVSARKDRIPQKLA